MVDSEAEDVPCSLRIRPRPAAARVPVREVVDQLAPLGELCGAEGDRLARSRPTPSRTRIEAALSTRPAARQPGELRRAELLDPAVAARLG